MNKLVKFTSNSLLLMFLFGLFVLPIASITLMGVKPEDKNVLSTKDVRPEIQQQNETKETTQSTQSTQVIPKTF